MALRLGKLCGNGPDLWLNLQKRYDLHQAQQELDARPGRIAPRECGGVSAFDVIACDKRGAFAQGGEAKQSTFFHAWPWIASLRSQ